MSTLLNDLRYAVRQLAKSPGFAVIAILTLTLGIGANTAIFSVVNAVLLNPLPYPQPDRIMVLFHDKPNFRTESISYPNFDDWRRENQSFSSMAAIARLAASPSAAAVNPRSQLARWSLPASSRFLE
jgi:MacB-like periplasmic core domain